MPGIEQADQLLDEVVRVGYVWPECAPLADSNSSIKDCQVRQIVALWLSVDILPNVTHRPFDQPARPTVGAVAVGDHHLWPDGDESTRSAIGAVIAERTDSLGTTADGLRTK